MIEQRNPLVTLIIVVAPYAFLLAVAATLANVG